MKSCILLMLCVLTGCISPQPDFAGSLTKEWLEVLPDNNPEHWVPFVKKDYEEGGPSKIENGVISLGAGAPYSAALWNETFPSSNYEIKLKARRTKGMDIFCGILFPIGTNYCTMILGGWGNSIVGLSCVDYGAAADNETGIGMSFENNQWYDIVLRVTDEKVETWIGDEQVIDMIRQDRIISPYPGLEIFAPLGFFTYQSSAELKDIYIREFKYEE